ncbi:MAG: hypothetical protein MUO63_08690 [Desulfobulbaceae bacterium]|nr:hypothetical protein [Desulfobulbaceae bacterium]
MKKVTASLAAAMLCFGLAGPAAAATYSLSYPDVPLPINDAVGNGNVVAGLTYADISDLGRLGDILDVNVFVDITHPWIGDLQIYISHSVDDGDTWKYVQLYNRDNGGFGMNMTNVLFDDQAATSISDATPPYGPGSFKPSSTAPDYAEDSNLLSFFNGDPAAGMWSLVLYDCSTFDIGTLNGFRLDIETDAPSNAVPLPGAILLFGSGLGVLAAVRRSRQKIV